MRHERFRGTWLDTLISLAVITLVVLVVVAAKDLAAEKSNFVPEVKSEFVATIVSEGTLSIRGRVRSELSRSTIESFARAKFEAEKVNNSSQLDPDLPADWLLRVLAGLDALSQLSTGALVVSQDQISISGTTDNPDATSNITRIVLRELGETTPLLINVTYETSIGPVVSLSRPEECQRKIGQTLENRGISFEPGSANPSRDAGPVLDIIAHVLKGCGEIEIEIAGHTHSQGRAEMNLELSQARAQAVLGELRIRRVLNPHIKAVGYGEARPIADNNTYEGRRQNERIEIGLTGYQEPKTSVSRKKRLQAMAPMSRAEASARYAATGIWQVAPDQPLTPDTQAAPDSYIASLDAKVHVGDAITLPNPAEMARDAGLATQPSPGASRTEFVIDERGLVRAASGGALTPDGVPVFAGRPSILPPALPNRSATGAGSGTPHIALQRLAPFNPRSRPDNFVELNERSQLGGLTRSELALIRPKLRPEYLMQLRQRHLWPSLTPDELARIKPELLPNKVDPVAVERELSDLWAISVGKYSTRYQAERILLKTALLGGEPLNKALPRVLKTYSGYAAVFQGLSEAGASLECAKLRSRRLSCAILPPADELQHAANDNVSGIDIFQESKKQRDTLQTVTDGQAPSIIIVAVRPFWARLKSPDGAVVFERIMAAGETYKVPVTEPPHTIRIGDGEAVYLLIGGQLYGPAGERGAVVSKLALDAKQLTEKYTVVGAAPN